MRVLGISAFHRDAAAVLLVDGAVVAGAQEERFTRLPLDPAFPSRAIRWCLASAGIAGRDLDRVVFYEKPMRKFERVLARSLSGFPGTSRSFAKGVFAWLGERLWVKNRLSQDLEVEPHRVLFTAQAQAMAAAAFLTSPFERAGVLVLDDVGEWSTGALFAGEGAGLTLLAEQRFPHSLGLFASALTQFLGFVPGQDEHKLEALAALGSPRFSEQLGRLFSGSDAELALDQRPFAFDDAGARLYTEAFEASFGPARLPGGALRIGPSDARDADLAASAQVVIEALALRLARALAERVGTGALCLAGELARNRRLVSRLAAESGFEHVHVARAPGKAGAALGAALVAHHALEPQAARRELSHLAFGEDIDDRWEPGASELGGASAALAELGQRLERGELVGWARGRMEFGPHGLGARVALARAESRAPNGHGDARARLLGALQQVEDFLPCRIALPAERLAEWCEVPAAASRATLTGAALAAVARPALRAAAPSAVLADGTCHPQAVERAHDPDFHALLVRMQARTGLPGLLVHDLALRGSPLARCEADAVEILGRSGLDALVCGSRLYLPRQRAAPAEKAG